MTKTEAQRLLNVTTAADAAALIGCTPQAFSLWPEELTPRLRDRVQAALYRRQHGIGNDNPAPRRATAKPTAMAGQ